MKVVVFGGSGFLGSHVADVLTDAGYNVTIYDRVRSPYLLSAQAMVIGDIMDQKLVVETVRGNDIVYNFAGVADIEEAVQRPFDSVKFNIAGNSIILEACRKAKIKRFVFSSSVYVYSKAGSFYRSTKQACELLIENYQEIFGLPYTILRYGSLYGPRAKANNFIYKKIKQAVLENKLIHEGDGEEVREYIHVYDAARCSVEILSNDFVNQYVLISGDRQIKIKDLLQMIREMLGGKAGIQYIPPENNFHYEITPYTFTPKLAKRLSAKNHLDFKQGLKRVIENIK